jgi:predicted transcriptional regulator
MSETRDRIEAFVADNPGIHFSELVRRLDVARGQIQYHLRRTDSVVSTDFSGRTHYFPPKYDERERERIAALRRETASDATAVLLRRGPSGPETVADHIGVARSTLEWHLDHLEAADLVEKRRDDRGRVTLALVDPEETLSLLETVDPGIAVRLVDRFARLLDGLLEA